MSYPKKIKYISDTGETIYFKDENENFYALHYWYIDKSYFREFADVEPQHSYLDEDGDVCYEYDDDSWSVETDIVWDYIKDYIKREYPIYDEYNAERDEDVFRIKENDECYEEMIETKKSNA